MQGVRIALNAPAVTHLFFVDDCIIFSGAVNTYELASGQKVNLDKTDVCFSSGVVESRRRNLANILGVRVVEQHAKYLGIPTVQENQRRS